MQPVNWLHSVMAYTTYTTSCEMYLNWHYQHLDRIFASSITKYFITMIWNYKIKLKKWTDVYPQGTDEGDQEQAFFIALARNSKWQWRSTAALAKESVLTQKRVEEIINKYVKRNMVFKNPNNDDQWAYWERVPEMLRSIIDDVSLVQRDHNMRIRKAIDP